MSPAIIPRAKHAFRQATRPACLLAVSLACWSCAGSDVAANGHPVVRAAVAANFVTAHEELVRRFQVTTGIVVETSLGATGQLFAQIQNGAPYDIFLAADAERPRLLEETDLAVRDTRFTYALGRLALFAPHWDSLRSGQQELAARSYRYVAIANPRTAPYGAAARQVLEQWGLWNELERRIVRGENVGQAYQFVAAGAAEAGLVALAQVVGRNPREYWIVPAALHEPIRQDAVLLRQGEHNPGASDFLEFLQSAEGQDVIVSFGYTIP